jgi:hypothetical protein
MGFGARLQRLDKAAGQATRGRGSRGVARIVTGLATVVAVTLGLSLTVAGTASADEDGTWRAYGNTNPITSRWHCGATTTARYYPIKAQTCAIRSPDGLSVQAAVIVRNNGSQSLSVWAATWLYSPNNQIVWSCQKSDIAANSWSVCFGRTLTLREKFHAQGRITIGPDNGGEGIDLANSPTV